MIGLFGISEVLRNALKLTRDDDQHMAGHATEDGLASITSTVLPLAWRRKYHLLRSSATGAVVGMLPGAGADIAAWISYAVSKRFSHEPQKYGHGSLEGLGDATGVEQRRTGRRLDSGISLWDTR